MGDSAYSPRDPSDHILEKSYDMQRILNSLVRAGDHVGDASASSVRLMEESSVRGEQRQGASSPAAFSEDHHTSTCEKLWHDRSYRAHEQVMRFESMWRYSSDFPNLAEEMQIDNMSQPEEHPMIMTSHGKSISNTNNIIPPSSSRVMSASLQLAGTTRCCPPNVPDPFAADPIMRQGSMLQLPFRSSGAGSNSSFGDQDLITTRVEVDLQQDQLSWIESNHELNSTMMMTQAAAATASAPFSAHEIRKTALTANNYNRIKAGSTITGLRDSRGSDVESPRLHGSQMLQVARVGLQKTPPNPGSATPNCSDQSLCSSSSLVSSDGSGNATNPSSCCCSCTMGVQEQQQQQQQPPPQQQLAGVGESGNTTTTRPDGVGSVEGGDAQEDGSKLLLAIKPKKLQPSLIQPRKSMKRVKQPKHCIKTRTDVDIMDDNYKWRKYGQKAVKSSPYPRNYYKCSTHNCPVRKRVERCADDPGLVLTTYEGTHTHQSPLLCRLPFGAYIGGFSHLSYMQPLLISPTGFNPPNLTTSNLPLFGERLESTNTCNINSVGRLSRPMLSQYTEACSNTCNSIATLGLIAPSYSTAYPLPGSPQFGGDPLVDPITLPSTRRSNQSQQLAEDATIPNAQVEGPFLRTAPVQFAQAGTLQQSNNNLNKFVEAQLQSTTTIGQGLVDSGEDHHGLMRLPASLWSEEVQANHISWTDEGLLEDMVRPSIPTFGLT